MDVVSRLDSWFAEKLEGLHNSPEVVAYVAGVLARRRWEDADLSKRSVVLAFDDARARADFAAYQRIGDWVLWVSAVCPEHFNGVRETIEALGRRSYFGCFRLMKTWKLYEELADDFPKIVVATHRCLV